MPNPVSSIRNLGPAMQAAFARAGITAAEQIIAMGADDAYLALIRSGSRPHFITYYVIVMGLQGRPWNDCKGAEKAALRERFDALSAEAFDKGRSDLEAALDLIGVVAPKPAGAMQPAGKRQKSGQPTTSMPAKK